MGKTSANQRRVLRSLIQEERTIIGADSETERGRMERRDEKKGERIWRKDEGQFGSLLQQSVHKR